MRTALGLALALALCACQKPQPSPEYRQARDRHYEIIASYPLEAYARPEMDEVLALLDRVPKDSLDAEAATSLREKIVDERRAIAEEKARRAKLVESAGPSAAWAPGGVGGGGTGGGGMGAGGGSTAEGGETPPEGAGGAPAASRPPSQLAPGTPLADFQKAQGECFEAKAAARIGQREGKPLEGEAWGLKDDDACRKAHPDEVGRLALFADGKLLEVREASEGKATQVTQTVKGVRGKDGTTLVLPPGTRLPPGAKVTWSPPPAGAQPQPQGREKPAPPAPTPPPGR